MQRTFSPSEAAMSIFGLAKRQPQFVLRFCIIYALSTIVTFALAGALGVGKALQDYVALARASAGAPPKPEEVLALLTPVTGGVTVMLLFGAVTGVLLSAMGLRKAVRDTDAGLFGLQVGGDEIRLMIGGLILWAILIGVNVAVGIMGGLVSFGNAGLIGLTFVVSLLVMAYVGIRFSQIGVLTVADQTIAVMASWRETKGQSSRFLGAYLLWMVVGVVLTALVQGIGTLGAALLGAKVGGGMPATLPEFLTAGWLFYALIYGLVTGFTVLGNICIGAYAWHQMRGDLPTPASVSK
jgi:hypothetical protein